MPPAKEEDLPLDRDQKEALEAVFRELQVTWEPRTHACNQTGVECSFSSSGHDVVGNVIEIDWTDSNESLQGTLPTELGLLTHLTRLGLTNSKLHSSIVTELGHLTKLEHLELARNQIYGSIPHELHSLKSLKRFLLHRNDLTGSIPVDVVCEWPKLHSFDIFDNDMQGTVPDCLENMSSLRIYNAGLTGTLPASLCAISDLGCNGIACAPGSFHRQGYQPSESNPCLPCGGNLKSLGATTCVPTSFVYPTAVPSFSPSQVPSQAPTPLSSSGPSVLPTSDTVSDSSSAPSITSIPTLEPTADLPRKWNLRNPTYAPAAPSSGKSNSSKQWILISSLALVLSLMALFFVMWVRRRRRTCSTPTTIGATSNTTASSSSSLAEHQQWQQPKEKIVAMMLTPRPNSSSSGRSIASSSASSGGSRRRRGRTAPVSLLSRAAAAVVDRIHQDSENDNVSLESESGWDENSSSSSNSEEEMEPSNEILWTASTDISNEQTLIAASIDADESTGSTSSLKPSSSSASGSGDASCEETPTNVQSTTDDEGNIPVVDHQTDLIPRDSELL